MFLALVIALAPTVFTGCQIMPDSPKAVAFLTLKDTWLAESRVMQVYAVAAVKGKLSTDQRRAVWDAHAKFQAGFNAAFVLLDADWTARTPDDVDALGAVVIGLIQQLKL